MTNIDFHLHTNYSDGNESPKEVLTEADERELKIIAITDHNTVKAYIELQKHPEIRRIYKGLILSGTEITTTYNGEVVEVLGFGFDIDEMDQLLSDNVLTFYNKQIKESRLNLDTFLRYGVLLSPEFQQRMLAEPQTLFDPNHTSSRLSFLEEMKRHPENAGFFGGVETMQNISFRDFTREYVYNPKSRLYVNQSPLYPSIDKTIDMIHSSSGIAFLAHLYEYSSTIANSLDNIVDNYKLDGLECNYPTFSRDQFKFLLDYCDRKNLYKTGGSDFHGLSVKPKNHMGLGVDNMPIDGSLIKPWIREINNISIVRDIGKKSDIIEF